METPLDKRRQYDRKWAAAGKRHHCSRCHKETPGSKSPYCNECWRAYLRERTEKRRAERKCACGNPVMVVNKNAIKLCEACRKAKQGAPLVACEKCGVLHKRRCRWNFLCAGCVTPPQEKSPRLCACGAVLENRKHKQCAACKSPKPILVPMTCQDCGVVVVSARNMIRCEPCRKKSLNRRKTERKNRQRKEKRCACGKPAAIAKQKLGRLCEACRQEAIRVKGSEHCHRRRARKKGSTVGRVSLRALWSAFNGVCPLCDVTVTRVNGHVDHIVPLARGGPHSQENLQILCGPCNVKKGAAPPRTSTSIPAHCTAGDNQTATPAVVE